MKLHLLTVFFMDTKVTKTMGVFSDYSTCYNAARDFIGNTKTLVFIEEVTLNEVQQW